MSLKAFLVIFLAGAAFAVGWMVLNKTPEKKALLARELATERMAQYLAQKYPGQRALIISNPYTRQKGLAPGVYDQEEAGIRGLRKGFANKVAVGAVAYPELKSGAQNDPRSVQISAGSTTPLSFLVTDDAFDKLARQHGCDLIVSLIGLPVNLGAVEAWRRTGKPKFALLLPDLRMVGDAAAIQSAVKAEKLAVFVLNKPGAPPEQSRLSDDRQAEFERRYILVTPETIDQVLQSYPQLFNFSTNPLR